MGNRAARYVGDMRSSTVATIRSRLGSSSWWLRSPDGRLALWQFPNPALAVWLITLVLKQFDLSPAHARTVADIGTGALLVWALDEVLRGASPFRRTLGSGVLFGQLTSLLIR